MKKLSNAPKGRQAKTAATIQLLPRSPWNTGSFFYLVALLSTFLFTGCKKQDIKAPESEAQLTSNQAANEDKEFRMYYDGLAKQTVSELQQARAATARYRNIKNAFADGYQDISVVVQNMGHHYMKSNLVNATFEVRKPEILVYDKQEDGSFQLVAVEYAVPIELTPEVAPQGFTGTGDVWDRNTGFGLWLLHAWVWKNNPNGVFNPTNPLVHLHEH
jgi:hypothetical protein